jgi:hypothetical protein
MSITNMLLKMNPLLMLGLFIIFFSGAGIVGTYLVRKYSKIGIRESHNEGIANGFAMTGGLYGLILAFVVFLVWDQFNDAQQKADMEASLCKGLYRNIKYYPVDNNHEALLEKKKLTETYMNYLEHVIIEDSLLNTKGKESVEYKDYRYTKTVKSFNTFYKMLEEMNDTVTYKNQRIEEMFKQLNDLGTYRNLRSLAVESEIDFYIWVPLWLGGIIIMLFAYLMNIENKPLHIGINGLIGAFIALVFYIIVLTDHPFNGRMRIDIGKNLNQIIEWEQTKMME